MLTKVQDERFAAKHAERIQPKLSALEKGMLKWAVVDPQDKVLDAKVGGGLMIEYLRRNLQCEVCGVSDNMDVVSNARNRLVNCDIVYASPEDIPWPNESFDTVMLKLDSDDADTLERMLQEVMRVLKEGGQFLLGLKDYPIALQSIVQHFSDDSDGSRRITKNSLMERLTDEGFEQLSWQRTSFSTGVLTAWKNKPGIADALAN